jgi:hypothetical protein
MRDAVSLDMDPMEGFRKFLKKHGYGRFPGPDVTSQAYNESKRTLEPSGSALEKETNAA